MEKFGSHSQVGGQSGALDGADEQFGPAGYGKPG